MKKVWSVLKLAPRILVSRFLACNRSIRSPQEIELIPQAVKFGGHTVNLLSIGQLTHKFSLGPPEDRLVSECYTHLSETMEQVLCWTKIEPDYEPDLADHFAGMLDTYSQRNLLGPNAYIASPRGVSGLQAIEFEAYLQGVRHAITIRSLLWAISGNMWHVTFVFVTGNPEGEATVERVYSSVRLEGEATPVKIHGYVPELPRVPRGSERVLLQVTSEGEIHLNGKVASRDDVRRELIRLSEVGGIVLYDRAGGLSPPPDAGSVSAEILFEIGLVGVEFLWLETSHE